MLSNKRWILAGLFVAVSGAAVVGHVRLETSGGNPFFWSNEDNVPIVVSSSGSDNIADESETAAVRLALEEWNLVPGSTARLIENTSAIERARTDWDDLDLHQVLFDEDDSSAFFPGFSGIVAITPISYLSNGRIVDADVIFNGNDWSFTTTGDPGAFDVQDVATHELGHLLGLDHSGWAGATMYPFVDPTLTLHRSLSLDEVNGMRHAYPTQTFGRLHGTVERMVGGPVEGANVVARNAQGRTVGASLSDGNGDFTLFGLPAGSYTVYAVPLDAPFNAEETSAFSDSLEFEFDFEPALYSSSATIVATESVNMGTLVVDEDVPVSLGMPSDLLAVTVTAGETTGPVFLSGTGLVPGSTLEASDPDLTLDNVIFSTGTVSFAVTVPAGELPGHVDLTVTTPSGDISILPAALEITSPAPEVDMVDPSEGSSSGGTLVMIEGAGFRAGARVVIGDQVYTDGVDATVVDAGTLTLTTHPTVAGDHDVVVFDASGVEGRLETAFHVGLIPAIQALFPSSGDSAGGTQVTVTGTDFVSGLEVRIAGDVQIVDSISPTQVVFTTVASGAPLGVPQTVEIENPDGETASSQFTFQGQPDPVLVSLSPDRGKTKGGDLVTLTGTDFTSDSEVWFGVDPLTGSGGVQSSMVTFVDATTLQVLTPALSKGEAAVLVRDASSGQGSILPAAFTFTSSSSGGGGCTLRPLDGEDGPPLAGAWWMFALLALLAGRSLRAATKARLHLR